MGISRVRSASLAAASVAALLGATAVNAADFTGPRVEIHAGWDQLRYNLADVNGSNGSEKSDGFTYGGTVGYDYQAPQGFIIGIEASLDDNTSNVGSSNNFANGTIDSRRDIAGAVRIGRKVTDNAMLYVKAEYDYSNYQDGVTRNSLMTGIGYRF